MTRAEEVRLLRERASEDTTYRTVASRADYASFTRCMLLAQARGFVPVRTGGDHIGMADYLRDRGKHAGLGTAHLLHRIGAQRLPKLKRLRTFADYDPHKTFTSGMAQEAVDLMDEIEGLLDQGEAEVQALAG